MKLQMLFIVEQMEADVMLIKKPLANMSTFASYSYNHNNNNDNYNDKPF